MRRIAMDPAALSILLRPRCSRRVHHLSHGRGQDAEAEVYKKGSCLLQLVDIFIISNNNNNDSSQFPSNKSLLSRNFNYHFPLSVIHLSKEFEQNQAHRQEPTVSSLRSSIGYFQPRSPRLFRRSSRRCQASFCPPLSISISGYPVRACRPGSGDSCVPFCLAIQGRIRQRLPVLHPE